MKAKYLITAALLLGNTTLFATPSLPQVFQSGMVLQRQVPIPVWGQAQANAQVSIDWQGAAYVTQADEQGQWYLQLPPSEAMSEECAMTISDPEGQVVLDNLLIGDVWLASGQSNMQWCMRQYADTAKLNSTFTNDQIKIFNISPIAGLDGAPFTIEEYEKMRKDGQFSFEWQSFIPENTQEFSALASCFAKNMQEELHIPIGIICNAIGGSSMIHWLPQELIEHDARFEEMRGNKWLNATKYGAWCKSLPKGRMKNILDDPKLSQEPLEHPFAPAFLYEKTVAPLLQMPIKGVIWYQGETNAEAPFSDEDNLGRLRDLIRTWRDAFQQAQLPFYMVQLPRFGTGDRWANFREVQEIVSDETDKVELICTLDLGEKGNIHPAPKAPVARRLADCVLQHSYGIDKSSSARITGYQWNDTGALLELNKEVECTDENPTGFEVSFDGGQNFSEVEATIDGDKIQVLIDRPNNETGEIRYNFRSYMEPNIVTKGTDLPLFPWRSK